MLMNHSVQYSMGSKPLLFSGLLLGLGGIFNCREKKLMLMAQEYHAVLLEGIHMNRRKPNLCFRETLYATIVATIKNFIHSNFIKPAGIENTHVHKFPDVWEISVQQGLENHGINLEGMLVNRAMTHEIWLSSLPLPALGCSSREGIAHRSAPAPRMPPMQGRGRERERERVGGW